MRNVIVGAGLAGLMCACAFDGSIYEAGNPVQQHRALLRFRDDSVSKLTGINFKSVKVSKEIWHDSKTYRECSNAHANMYAHKVTGSIIGRSIRDLSTVTRYVAPDDFYQQLVNRHEHRILWNRPVGEREINAWREEKLNIINTSPLHVILDALRASGFDVTAFDFERRAITVARLELDPKAIDVYQTIYYPGEDTPVYRASITGSTLIIESMQDISVIAIDTVMRNFGIPHSMRISPPTFVEQKYGKIKELPRHFREAVLYELTKDHGIFSVGRFATWRNVLLDDVAEDIKKIARLISASQYGRALIFER